MFTAKLVKIRQLSDSTRDFQFVRNDGEILEYVPGQFFRFTFTDSRGEFERSYSLCNYDPLYSDQLDLVISKVEGGRATELLFSDVEQLQGLEASITGPYGRLVLPKEQPDRLIMVATSVGLAPYMPILKQMEEAAYGQRTKVVLLLGVRDRGEFIYSDVLLDYAKRNDWFELKLCMSRETATEPHESDGYVQLQLAALQPDKATDHLLLCGNPAMVEECWQQLKTLAFRPKQVVREKYVFARDDKPKKKSSGELTDEQKKLIAEKMKRYQS